MCLVAGLDKLVRRQSTCAPTREEEEKHLTRTIYPRKDSSIKCFKLIEDQFVKCEVRALYIHVETYRASVRFPRDRARAPQLFRQQPLPRRVLQAPHTFGPSFFEIESIPNGERRVAKAMAALATLDEALECAPIGTSTLRGTSDDLSARNSRSLLLVLTRIGQLRIAIEVYRAPWAGMQD